MPHTPWYMRSDLGVRSSRQRQHRQQGVTCFYGGIIVCQTEQSIGLGQGQQVSVWLPKKFVRGVRYVGDPGARSSQDYRIGAAISSVDLPRWLAVKKGLFRP